MSSVYCGPPKTVWLYQLQPLDMFDGLLTVEEVARRGDPSFVKERDYQPFGGAMSPLDLYLEVSIAARKRWGDDHVTAGPFVMPLPLGESCLGFLLLWKHSHAGTTYVASPLPLVHLDRWALDRFTIECRHRQAVPRDVTDEEKARL